MSKAHLSNKSVGRLQMKNFGVVNMKEQITLACTRIFVEDTRAASAAAAAAATASNGAEATATANSSNPSLQRQEHKFSPNCIVFVHQFGMMGGASLLLRGIAMQCARMLYAKQLADVLPQDQQFDCITFDLRGVGRSTGSSTLTCTSEINDVRAVVEHLENHDVKRIFLLGSSAGACIAGSSLGLSNRILAAGLIAYPYGWTAGILFGTHFTMLKGSSKPKFFVFGDSDGFSSQAQQSELIKSCAGGPVNEHVTIEGGHFEIEQSSHDERMARYFSDFFVKILLAQQQQP